MSRIRVAGLAERDLDAIWLYVAKKSQSIEIADSILNSIVNSFAMLARTPEAGTRREHLEVGLRGFPVGNYIIYYRETRGRVLISRVLHGRRDQKPAYLEDDQ